MNENYEFAIFDQMRCKGVLLILNRVIVFGLYLEMKNSETDPSHQTGCFEFMGCKYGHFCVEFPNSLPNSNAITEYQAWDIFCAFFLKIISTLSISNEFYSTENVQQNNAKGQKSLIKTSVWYMNTSKMDEREIKQTWKVQCCRGKTNHTLYVNAYCVDQLMVSILYIYIIMLHMQWASDQCVCSPTIWTRSEHSVVCTVYLQQGNGGKTMPSALFRYIVYL